MTDDELLTFATMAGADFYYDDFGHPHRSSYRMHWTCSGACTYEDTSTTVFYTAYGHTEADAAKKWLLQTGLYWKIT